MKSVIFHRNAHGMLPQDYEILPYYYRKLLLALRCLFAEALRRNLQPFRGKLEESDEKDTEELKTSLAL